jgi:lactate dehydrogenase-like 2-hydroxyacid dehydrogenase
VLPSVRSLIAGRRNAVFNETGAKLSPQQMARAAHGCDAIMITGTDRVDRAAIRRLPASVKAIATYSVGHDHIDLHAAAEHELAVFNTPDVLTDAVAEIALFLLIGAARRATESLALIRSREWQGWSSIQLPGIQLCGKRLGIVGMGRIGRAVARRARAFGMELHYSRATPLTAVDFHGAVHHRNLAEMLPLSQFLLLSCQSTPDTRSLLNRNTISLLPDGAIVTNIARGDVVHDDSLIDALTTGKLLAAGLDVFANEPRLDERYLTLPNVFATPHIGSSTIEAREAMARILLDGLQELDCGRWPANRLV